MKKLTMCLFFGILFIPAVAFCSPQADNNQSVQKPIQQTAVVDENSIIGSKDPDLVPLQRGCCSWHGGVAGCDDNNGRVICNDGTYSPSCKC